MLSGLGNAGRISNPRQGWHSAWIYDIAPPRRLGSDMSRYPTIGHTYYTYVLLLVVGFLFFVTFSYM